MLRTWPLESLYLEELHVGLDPGENGGLVEELPGGVGRPAHQAMGALLLGVLNHAAHLQQLLYSLQAVLHIRIKYSG